MRWFISKVSRKILAFLKRVFEIKTLMFENHTFIMGVLLLLFNGLFSCMWFYIGDIFLINEIIYISVLFLAFTLNVFFLLGLDILFNKEEGLLDDEKRYRYSVSQEKKKVDKNVQKGVKHRMKKRILSFILSLVMVIGIIPTSVFAEGDSNTDTGETNQQFQSFSDGSWWGSNRVGMRFSLYFTDFTNNDGEKVKINSKEEFLATEDQYNYRFLGKLEMYKDLRANDIDYFTGLTVFQRMTGGGLTLGERQNSKNLMDSSEFKTNYAEKAISYKDILPNFPTVIEEDENVKVDNQKFVKYFLGETYAKSNNWNDIDTTNLDPVLNKIIEGTDIEKIYFKDGSYITSDGLTYQGAFKFYFEPVGEMHIDGKTMAMSLRDMIAFQNANPNNTYTYTPKSTGKPTKGKLQDAFWTFSLHLANATYLSKNEPLIRMSGTSGTISSSKYSEDSTMYNSGGVGVITGMPDDPKFTPPTVKIVTSVVKVDDYKVENNEVVANLSEAENTTLREGKVE